MRDDTASLVTSILKHFDTRIMLLEELLRREQDLSYSIQQGPAEIQAILDECAEIISRITGVDCDIAGSKDNLCHVSGILRADLEKALGADSPEVLKEWHEKQKRMSDLAGRICSIREESIRTMEETNRRTAKDAEELSVISRLLGKFKL